MIKSLIAMRKRYTPLRRGDYTQLHVAHEQFSFMRRDATSSIVVAVNAADHAAEVPLRISDITSGQLIDVLNEGAVFDVSDGQCKLPVAAQSGRILEIR